MAAIVVGLACGVGVTVGQPAGAAEPRPSAEEVSKARKEVRERAAELDEVAVRLATARARQEELSVSAERAVEAYNEAKVRAAEAAEIHERAEQRAEQAERSLASAREDIATIAAESYGGYDVTRPKTAMLAGRGGVEGYLQRTSVLSHLGDERAHKLRRLRDVQQVRAIMRDQARDTYEERLRSAELAEEAKQAAEDAVRMQVEETQRIEQEQAKLEERLDKARSRADRIERRRAAARDVRRLPHVGAAKAKWAKAKWVREALAEGAGAARGDIAASWALTQLGKPYVWAADGPHSYDCSGLTMRAWEKAGVQLDHWTGTQWRSGPHVSIEELRRGDLVFFGRVKNEPRSIHHVGIYIGEGMMVHAPQTGDVVRVAPIWRRDLFGATRPAG